MNKVHFGNIAKALKDYFSGRTYSNIAVLVDENTLEDCYPLISDIIPDHQLIQIKSGEEFKTIHTCEYIWTAMTELRLDRGSLLINLGGGVIGDMGGFSASCFKRGIEFIQIPTTLLAMVDASVGGKTGIDFHGLKNQIGLFSEADKVFIDDAFLQTLDERQLMSGGAEMIKHGLISDLAVEEIYQLVKEKQFSLDRIQASVEVKNSYVINDFKEVGQRKVLNFGHTIGHAIESFFLDKEQLLHGEAVMVGMVCELFLSIHKCGLDEKVAMQHIEQINSIYKFRKMHRDEREGIAEYLIHDKKNDAGQVKAVLLKAIGLPEIDVAITTNEVLDALKFYNAL